MNSGLRLFPEEASTQAPATDTLFLILLIVSAAIITLVVTLIITFSLRYRRGTNANRGPLRDIVSREFEIGWTAGTCFLALFLFWWSGSTNLSTLIPPRDAMEIHVVGKQWMWKTQHANGAREINTLHVPVNEPVRLVMTSEDVIHSFYVPDFRIKRDVLPGPLHRDLVQRDQDWDLSPVLHAVLRHGTFAHDRRDRGHAEG